jgi:UPF0755 protein
VNDRPTERGFQPDDDGEMSGELRGRSPSGMFHASGGGRRPGRTTNRLVVMLAFIVVVAIVVGGVIAGMAVLKGRPGKPLITTTTAAATIKVTVDKGATAEQVASLLEAKGVIKSADSFIQQVKTRGSEGRLKPGIYDFSKDEDQTQVIVTLEQGTGAETFKVTIPEGLAVTQIAALLDKGNAIKGASYIDLASQPKKFVIPPVGPTSPTITTLEGLLFPSTYTLLAGSGANELIGLQLSAFQSKTASLPWNNATELKVTPYEIVIIASLIEKEVRVPEERAKVAAVIYNRLAKDMQLGIDATVRYAVGKWTGPLTEADLQVDSPYNTRLKKGLPPAPISNPGLASLEAALQPAPVDYLYYVLIDKEGDHFFTNSIDEFNKTKATAPAQ